MALEGITTLSTWVETTGRMTIQFFTALITFFLFCIVTWCFTWFHLLRRGRGYINAIFFFGLFSECYVIWFEIDRIEICTVRCWTRAFAVVTWILSFNDGWLLVFLVTCFTATNSLPGFLKKMGDWIEGYPRLCATNTRDLSHLHQQNTIHVHHTTNTTNYFTPPPREHGRTKLDDDQSPRYSRVCPSTRFKDDIGLGGENLQLGSSSSSRRDRLIELGEGKNIESLIGIDDECKSEIISKEDENDQFMLSPRHKKNRKAWQRIVAKQAADVAFDAECVGVNRGGAIFLVEGLRAFLPGSHLMGRLPDGRRRRRRCRRRHPRYHLSGVDGSQLMPGGLSASMDPLEALLGSFPCARVRGIPYEATLEDVLVFFQGLVVIDVVLVSHPEEELGEAFVVFANPMDFQMGLQR